MASSNDLCRIIPGQLYYNYTPDNYLNITKRLNQIENILAGKLTDWNAPYFPTISSGIVAPSSTPSKIGDIYCDTVAMKVYISTGTSSSADWRILN